MPHYEKELTAKYGTKHAARVVRQERDVTDMAVMTEGLMRSALRASQERVRNLLGADFEIVDEDGCKIGRGQMTP